MPYAVSVARSLVLASLAAALGAGAACNKAADEPVTAASGDAPKDTGPAVQPLAYDAPPAWQAATIAPRGSRKALYSVPRTAGDVEDADAVVLFYGTGSLGDPKKNFDAWLREFDGDVTSTSDKLERETFECKAGKVTVVKLSGSYKRALAPPRGPKKQVPVTQLKEGFRVVAAVVETKDRGNWFVRMLGPEKTVRANEPDLRKMLESAR